MQNISVRRYEDPKSCGWSGCLEPADRRWIAFIDLGGCPRFFLNRDTETGAVLPDDPAERDAAIAAVRAEQGRRSAFVEHTPGVVYPSFAGEAFGVDGLPIPPGSGGVDGLLVTG